MREEKEGLLPPIFPPLRPLYFLTFHIMPTVTQEIKAKKGLVLGHILLIASLPYFTLVSYFITKYILYYEYYTSTVALYE